MTKTSLSKMPLDFPTVYLLRIGFEDQTEKLQGLEREIGIGKSLTYNSEETNLFIGKVSKEKRAIIELKAIGVFTEPAVRHEKVHVVEPPKKRRKVERCMEREDGEGWEWEWVDSGPESEDVEDMGNLAILGTKAANRSSSSALQSTSKVGQRSPVISVGSQDDGHEEDTVKVLKLDWYTDSVKAGRVLPMDKYLVYEGRRIHKLRSDAPKAIAANSQANILSRALADSPPPAHSSYHHRTGHFAKKNSPPKTRKTPLLHETTSEHESGQSLPPLPDYLKSNYSCQRPTPSPTPNDAFIAQLKKIMRARQLQGDQIGEVAYNAAIASIAAYPYTITSVDEITRLPKCGPKYASLYLEWKDSGHIREVDEIESDPRLAAMNIFFGIYDVHGKTAAVFYDKGWRDLDDVVNFGWSSLSRAQQIGVKHYDDFQQKIPREEVKSIADKVLEYANKIRGGYQMVICGGYRKGKIMCGDVDILLSHQDEGATEFLIEELMNGLTGDGWVAYTLQTSTRNSQRGQETLNWKGGMPKSGSGFDTLDKALLVWQDADWSPGDVDSEGREKPLVFRRVDIIVSPWKTAGCAVLGWSGGTMFERDLRKYCRKVLGYKFDSSGVRRLSDGAWIDLEKGGGPNILDKEKMVFEGLGLEWIEPTLRCTDG